MLRTRPFTQRPRARRPSRQPAAARRRRVPQMRLCFTRAGARLEWGQLTGLKRCSSVAFLAACGSPAAPFGIPASCTAAPGGLACPFATLATPPSHPGTCGPAAVPPLSWPSPCCWASLSSLCRSPLHPSAAGELPLRACSSCCRGCGRRRRSAPATVLAAAAELLALLCWCRFTQAASVPLALPCCCHMPSPWSA